MNQTNQRRPRTWVLRVVQAVFALTVLNVAIGAIASIWLGQFSGDSSWWLVMALPQVSVALLAVLACWDKDSRPEGLGLITVMLNSYGMIFGIIFMQWLPFVIGVLTILAMRIRPRGKLFIEASPPPAGWSRP